MIKSGPIFEQAAKLGKASRDAYNPGLWLILLDLLKNWVAEGVAFDVNDFNGGGTMDDTLPTENAGSQLLLGGVPPCPMTITEAAETRCGILLIGEMSMWL